MRPTPRPGIAGAAVSGWPQQPAAQGIDWESPGAQKGGDDVGLAQLQRQSQGVAGIAAAVIRAVAL